MRCRQLGAATPELLVSPLPYDDPVTDGILYEKVPWLVVARRRRVVLPRPGREGSPPERVEVADRDSEGSAMPVVGFVLFSDPEVEEEGDGLPPQPGLT
jgi:hypothetical protein